MTAQTRGACDVANGRQTRVHAHQFVNGGIEVSLRGKRDRHLTLQFTLEIEHCGVVASLVGSLGSERSLEAAIRDEPDESGSRVEHQSDKWRDKPVAQHADDVENG